MTSSELVAALRSKTSRDNRGLLDEAADRIDSLYDEISNLRRGRDEAIRECMAIKERLGYAESVLWLATACDQLRQTPEGTAALEAAKRLLMNDKDKFVLWARSAVHTGQTHEILMKAAECVELLSYRRQI